jgi:hypothetical protein
MRFKCKKQEAMRCEGSITLQEKREIEEEIYVQRNRQEEEATRSVFQAARLSCLPGLWLGDDVGVELDATTG